MGVLDDLWTSEPWAAELADVAAFLRRYNVLGLDDAKVVRLARSLVMEAAWAKNWRANKRVRPDRNIRSLTNVSTAPKGRTIAADLKRIKAAILRGPMPFTLAWVEASPAAQHRVGRGRLTLADLMNGPAMLARIEAALTAPDLKGRPRSDELDRVAISALIAFEALVGPATATRRETDLADKSGGRMAYSDAHGFLVKASELLDLPLSGSGDDARLRRLLRQRRAAKTQAFPG